MKYNRNPETVSKNFWKEVLKELIESKKNFTNHAISTLKYRSYQYAIHLITTKMTRRYHNRMVITYNYIKYISTLHNKIWEKKDTKYARIQDYKKK